MRQWRCWREPTTHLANRRIRRLNEGNWGFLVASHRMFLATPQVHDSFQWLGARRQGTTAASFDTDPDQPHSASNGRRFRNGALAIQNGRLEQGGMRCGVGEKWDSSDETRRVPFPQQRERRRWSGRPVKQVLLFQKLQSKETPSCPATRAKRCCMTEQTTRVETVRIRPAQRLVAGRPNNASHQFTDSHLGPHQKGAPGGFSIPKESTRQDATVMRTEGHQDV